MKENLSAPNSPMESVTVSDVDSPLGPALLARFENELQGVRTYIATLYLVSPRTGQPASVTVAAVEPQEVERLYQVVVSSLREAAG